MTDSSDSEKRAFTALPKGEPEEAAAQEAPARRGIGEGLGIFMLVILASLSGGLIAVYWPWIMHSGSDDRVTTLENRLDQIAAGQAPKAAAAAFQDAHRDLAALKTRIDADEARLNELEKANPAAADMDAIQKNLAALNAQTAGHEKSLGDLSLRVAALEKTAPPPDLPQRLDSFADKTNVAALDARVTKLEARDPAAAMRRAASVLALAELVRTSESDAPFASELSALKALSPQPEISDLDRYAKKGIPTLAMLQQRFPATADAILAAERRSTANDWLDRVWASFVTMVSVRRVGNVQGNSTEARIARAEFDLKGGDLAGSISELQSLVGPARNAAQAWLDDAKARAAVTQDTRALTDHVIAGLAPQQ